jgi:hypothetical protein
MGGALGSNDFGRESEKAASAGVSEEVRSLRENAPFSMESGNRRKPEHLEGDRKERRGGTGEPNSRYGCVDTLREARKLHERHA